MNKFNSLLLAAFLVLIGVVFWVLAQNPNGNHHGHDHHGHDHHGHDHGLKAHHEGHQGHAHVAPHGGCLVVFGHEFAHLELVLDQKTGALKAYILDGEAKTGVRITQSTLNLRVKVKGEAFSLQLKAEANELSGEKVGDSSVFGVVDARMKDLIRFGVVIEELEIRGSAFDGTQFDFPKGNH